MFISDQTAEWCHAEFCESAHDTRPDHVRGIANLRDWFAMWRGI